MWTAATAYKPLERRSPATSPQSDFIFDGHGNLAATLLLRVNGNNVPLTITGTYSVNADCKMSDTWHASNGLTTFHESVIVDNGEEYFILNDTSGDGSVISGEAKKQFISK